MRYFILLTITSLLVVTSAAPGDRAALAFEQAMLNNLHRPLYDPGTEKPHKIPKKGEHFCKSSVCKNKPNQACEDCQQTVPLDFS